MWANWASVAEKHVLAGLLAGSGVKPWHCQAALAGTQVAFCMGSVYLKNNLRSLDSGQVFHPIIYALVGDLDP